MRTLQRLSLSLLVLLAAASAFAQRSTGTIRGTVTDPAGLVVQEAEVTVRNENTGLTRSMATNSAGIYVFTDLPVGSYEITVKKALFNDSVQKNIVLNAADTLDLKASLALASGDVSITIIGEGGVKLTGDGMSGLIPGRMVRELPLNGRNPMQLPLLMPGVSAPDALNVKDKGLLGGSDMSVSGSTVTSNIWTVDGANNNDVGSNRTILVYPSVDSIEEFKIQRNSYGAEFGGAGGAHVNISTRGGTNDFHGTLFYAGRTDRLNRANYFLAKAGKDKEKLKRNDFGYTFGGPLMKNKLHFFFSQEWNRETRGSVRQACVPTLAQRQGDFSGSGCADTATLNDPLTGAAFPGRIIPSNRLSPGAQAMMKLFPAPNTSQGAFNWIDSVNVPINWRQENARVDWTLNDSTRLMVRYTQDSWVNDAPSLQSNLWGDDPFPAIDSSWNQPSRSLIFQLNKNIGSSAVNTLTFSYSANKIEITRPEGAGKTLNREITSAIPTTFPLANKRNGEDIPHPVFWGGVGAGPDLWAEAPFLNNQDLFVVKDDYSQVFGKHFLKLGVLLSTNKKNEDGGGGPAEVPQFWGPTGLNGWGGTTGSRLGDFMLKDMYWGFSELDRESRALLNWRDIELYASDSYKAHSRLTVDVGARVSFFPHPEQDDKLASSFHPSVFSAAAGDSPCNGLFVMPGTDPCGALGFAGSQQAPSASLMASPSALFAPRVGFAWDMSGTGKTALRAGLGLFYVRERMSPSLGLSANPPFAKFINDTRSIDAPCATCANGFGRPTSGRDIDGEVPNNWQWNVALEREIFKNTTMELAYVGNKGSSLLRSRDINQVPHANRLAYVRAQGNDDAQDAQRPYNVWGGNNRIVFWSHDGNSIYHGLQTQVVSRFGEGSQFQASYTWSKALATDPLDNSNGGIDPDVALSDLTNPDLDYGPARTNRTHIFNASLVLQLPKLDGKGGFARHVFGDWQIGTIVQASSGQNISVYSPSAPIAGGGSVNDLSGGGFPNQNRPNRVEGVSCRGEGDKEQIFNPAAFTLTGYRLGTIGTSGRGICEGPRLLQADLALYKNVRLSQRVTAQLRFDVFNVFNNTNFLANSVANNTFTPTVTLDGATLADSTTITSSALPENSNFGRASGARDPRQAQFGVKLIF
jgi:hypothetical protein